MSENLKKSSVRESFGKRLRKIRRDQDLTQEKLAELTNLHTTYISSVERGLRNLALENIVALCKALKCCPNDLIKID